MQFNPSQALSEINEAISQLSLKKSPQNLYDPIRYLMALGGKRMRPMLTLIGYSLFKDDYQKALYPALGVEVFHNFTLMHDDIMDKAPLRRGNPTVHEKWNDSVAILSGDTMLVKAYELMMEVETSLIRQVLQLFNQCAAEVCEGQQLDMDFETQDAVTKEEYLEMIRLKTAVLPGFCLQLGALIAQAPAEQAEALRQIGENMGIAFQLKDDLLDVYGNQAQFGKKVGGDIAANKKTFLMITAREQATGNLKHQLEKWLATESIETETAKIEGVTAIYNQLKIREQTETKIEAYFQKALKQLEDICTPDIRKQPLIQLMEQLAAREK